MRIASLASLILCTAGLVAEPVAAAAPQRLGKAPFEDALHGLRMRIPSRWPAQALPAGSDRVEVIQHFDSGDGAHLLVSLWSDPTDTEDDPHPVLSLPLAVNRVLAGGSLRRGIGRKRWSKPLVDERVPLDDRELRHLQFRFPESDDEPCSWFVDAWVIPGGEEDIGIAYVFGGEDVRPPNRRVRKLIEGTVASVERFEVIDLSEASGYEQVLAYHRAEVAPLANWRIVETDSRKFLLKTSHDDAGFVEDVVERLEASRLLFEADFPPPEGFDAVSVVRLCSSDREFHQYGNTSRGVMGWFNPRSIELVLFDAQAVDRNMTYAVMTHEAFHQYCHFLFGEAEAHRWFDEGHGDYYGGVKWSARGKARVTARMPGGLDRLGAVRRMVREGSYQPLDHHLRANHREWRAGGVDSYAQSWSLVYMLRQGMLGNVHRKVWRPEYAEILPSYVRTLKEEFARARTELDDETDGATEDGEADPGDEDDDEVSEERKQEAWKAAIDASWGAIDLATFEDHWRLYVKKYLK